LLGVCKTMDSFKMGTDSEGNPLIKDCLKTMFSDYYMTPEAMSAFENLYTNKDGVQDAFLGFWDAVSKSFSDNPYVIGYDIINEPLMANVFKHITYAYPGKVDQVYLQPLYQKAHTTIRKND
jgi:aryl-phospho-beta-D-glucosidase BglC (GH1 family)